MIEFKKYTVEKIEGKKKCKIMSVTQELNMYYDPSKANSTPFNLTLEVDVEGRKFTQKFVRPLVGATLFGGLLTCLGTSEADEGTFDEQLLEGLVFIGLFALNSKGYSELVEAYPLEENSVVDEESGEGLPF